MSIRGIKQSRLARRVLSREGRLGRRQRLRSATKRIKVPHLPSTPPVVTEPVVTHADEATIERTHAVNSAIAERNEQEAADIQVELASARADAEAVVDTLKELSGKRKDAIERRRDFAVKAEAARLGHELVASSHWPAVFITVVAILFETIALATPMQLLGAGDLGGAQLAALLLGFGYAVLLAVLSKGVGQRLKYKSRWSVLEADDPNTTEAEGHPRSVSSQTEDRVIISALASGALALVSAAVIRQAAIGILASAGQSQVAVSWPIFLMLTLAIFVAVAAISYWKAAPIAERYERLEVPVERLDRLIEAKRRECFQHAARVAGFEIRLQAIEGKNEDEQLAQLYLAAEEISLRRAANPHVYGIAINPARIQNTISNPKNYIRRLYVPQISDLLVSRVEGIRQEVASLVDSP
jgi:hypothetical protein